MSDICRSKEDSGLCCERPGIEAKSNGLPQIAWRSFSVLVCSGWCTLQQARRIIGRLLPLPDSLSGIWLTAAG
jgi:hypothetical protein